MALRTRRAGANGLEAWPGYVDALSTLLMVVMFVLLVFVLAQAFLSVTLSSRDKQLDQVNQELAKLTDMLSLARTNAANLQASIAQLNQQVATGNEVRAALAQRLTVAQGQVAQSTQAQQGLAAQLADANARAAAAGVALADASKARDELAAKLAEATARAGSATQQATEAQRFSDTARAQIELLNQQVAQLKDQMAAVAKALDLAEAAGRDKDTQIANLGQRLNAALAAKVEELQQYRSEFFGKLRAVLANRPGVSVVGDRFVFQSEVLFPLASADLTEAGVTQMNALADTVKQIMPEIPGNIHWILQVNGYTDRQPIKGGRFESNWELSAARAITVVKLLIADGVPAEHLAATGFADYQPLDAADTPEAYAKNRRIELRLTDR
jgi:chemotaxis protein MotB